MHEFFFANRAVIQFIYGLVFFVLGLAIALQSRRSSRLDLARSLTWLAAFGITHGLHEWGDLFIPIQAAYLDPPAIEWLLVIKLVLLGISFVCLLGFGVALLRPPGRARWLHRAPAIVLALWLLGVWWLHAAGTESEASYNTAAALARYCIALPGGLLAAYGLRRQAYQRIAPLNVPHIVNWLRAAGWSLALYAVLGGLIPPPVSFFPGTWLNTATFEQALGVPPLAFRSLVGLILLITILRALEVFDVETERLIESMEQQQILAAERERIGRQLHDGAIQLVYTAGLLVESARKQAGPDGVVAERLDRALLVLNDAIRDLRRTLGELHTAPPAEPLPVALQRLAQDPRFHSLVDVELALDLPGEDALTALRAEHVLAIVNEALSNAVRHARARHVRIGAQRSGDRLVLTVQDDGVGLPRQLNAGYGLRNMRDRARLLGGSLAVDHANGKGALVTLDIPWRDER
jgi:signal transduction histidine kinase